MDTRHKVSPAQKRETYKYAPMILADVFILFPLDIKQNLLYFTMNMNSYQKEQLKSLRMITELFTFVFSGEIQKLKEKTEDYLKFRKKTASFLSEYFSEICTKTCYESRLSACCSKDGIITFFADMVINFLVSEPYEIENLKNVLEKPNTGFKCVYLGENGCMWKIKPVVCEFFLCDMAKKEIFDKNPRAKKMWMEFEKQKKTFTWPDKPVLFDEIEQYFIKNGVKSPIMYINHSPGLLRIKKDAIKKGSYFNER